METKKLYVGNLPWAVGDEQLREYFNRVGRVAVATVILDRETGRSRGFGFVEMSTPEEARKAVETLDATYLDSRLILVREARPEGTEGNNFYKMISDFVNFKAKLGDKFGFSVGVKHFTLVRDDQESGIESQVIE